MFQCVFFITMVEILSTGDKHVNLELVRFDTVISFPILMLLQLVSSNNWLGLTGCVQLVHAKGSAHS